MIDYQKQKKAYPPREYKYEPSASLIIKFQSVDKFSCSKCEVLAAIQNDQFTLENFSSLVKKHDRDIIGDITGDFL